MEYFYIVSQQLGMFAVYVFIGVWIMKKKIFTEQGLAIFSKYITKIALPLWMFITTLNGATREQFIEALPVIGAAAFMYLVFFIVFLILAGPLGLKGNRRNIFRSCSMFGNVGFMGIPIIAALFPEHGYLYIALFSVIDQLMLWTVGIDLAASVEGNHKRTPAERFRNMVNPATICISLAVIGIFAGIKLPYVLNTALLKIGATTTPLAMIYIGGLFCTIPLKRYLQEKATYVTVLVKMVLIPLFLYNVMSYFTVTTHEIIVTISVLSGMPTMIVMAMLAQNQHSDSDFAAGIIFVTTLFSLVTLPFICYFMG